MDIEKTSLESVLTREKLGQICLEAFDNREYEFGKTVIDILERVYGKSSLKVRPLSKRKLAHFK